MQDIRFGVMLPLTEVNKPPKWNILGVAWNFEIFRSEAGEQDATQSS
jgi:hypothetical protein